MLAIVTITILAYMLMGKRVEAQLKKLKDVDWDGKIAELFGKIREYGNRAGRVAVRPILQFYYVLTDSNTSTLEKALMYGAILYTVLPVSALPRSVFKFFGILDEGAAVLFVYKSVKDKITPAIEAKVDATIFEWFGYEYAEIISEEITRDKE